MSKTPTSELLRELSMSTNPVTRSSLADIVNNRVTALEGELKDVNEKAVEALESWGAYVPEYFQEKWDLQADIEQFRDKP